MPSDGEVAAALDVLRARLLPRGPTGEVITRAAGNRVSASALRLAAELATEQAVTEYPAAEAREIADRNETQLPVVEALEQLATQTRANLRVRHAALEPLTFGLYSTLKHLARFSPDPTLSRRVEELKAEIRVGGRKKRPS